MSSPHFVEDYKQELEAPASLSDFPTSQSEMAAFSIDVAQLLDSSSTCNIANDCSILSRCHITVQSQVIFKAPYLSGKDKNSN